jgi:porin
LSCFAHQPSNDALRDQYIMEAFYRWHLTPNLAFTPNVQMIVNPALNPDEDTLWVFGLRGRLTF